MPDDRYAPAAMPSGAVQRRLPASLQEHATFRLLFWGQAFSVVGDRITPVAIAFAVLGLGSATDLGLVMAAGGIPFALFALAGGVWADRVGRRRVMLASDVVRAVSQSITAALDANNGDVRAVQQHARHTNPQTTMRYDDNRRDLAGQVASGLASLLGETAGEDG